MSEPATHNRLSHFAINADDPDRALAFYRNVFGWDFQAWGPPGFFMGQVGNLHAAIQQRQEEPFPTLIGNFECSISVDDVERVCDLIVENGGVVPLPKVTIPNVCDIARVKDCEGNTFSVCKYFRS
ncbi:MAG: VOC family protein [Armatimonadetes bacterium]|nr:VOC family protein [Armatimonadota bacterium]